eukprot:4400353-Prorocentrum_lima.AAC.1
MTSSLVGSEMCIRDRPCGKSVSFQFKMPTWIVGVPPPSVISKLVTWCPCLLYTSDAADDM